MYVRIYECVHVYTYIYTYMCSCVRIHTAVYRYVVGVGVFEDPSAATAALGFDRQEVTFLLLVIQSL